jgi:hypothetical protein
MITPEQQAKIGQIMKESNFTPTSSSGGATSDWHTQIKTPPTAAPTDDRNIIKDTAIDYVKKVGDEFAATPGKIADDVNAGAKDIQEGMGQRDIGGLFKVYKGMAKAGFRTAADAANAIFAPISAAVGTVFEKTGISDIASHNKLVDTLSNQKWLQDFALKHPNAEQDFTRALTLAMSAADGGKIDPKTIIERTKTQLTDFTKGSGEAVNMGESEMKAPPADTSKLPFSPKEMESSISSPEVNKIQETISPKITSKETKAIIDEGRLTRGKESSIFGKQPDIVEQSEGVKRAAETINQQIPKAHEMNDVELSKALDEKTTSIAKSLQGEMQKTPIKTETTGKVLDAWKNLKSEQQSTPEFLDNEAGNKAFQKMFENHLKELEWDITDDSGKFKSPTPKTLDDVWNVRKSYDNSIPSNVKNATEASSPVLQGRKAMWLQNRAILNSVINDNFEGLGASSKKAFADMSDMYDARENIRSKAKVDTKGSEGVLPSTKKGWAKLIGGSILTLTGVDYALHKLGL